MSRCLLLNGAVWIFRFIIVTVRDSHSYKWGTHVNPWLIHVNVWQKPLQYCKVISLQLIKINEKKLQMDWSFIAQVLGKIPWIPLYFSVMNAALLFSFQFVMLRISYLSPLCFM